jgi:hypothetical protein
MSMPTKLTSGARRRILNAKKNLGKGTMSIPANELVEKPSTPEKTVSKGESVTLTYNLVLFKDEIENDPTDPAWKERVWKSIMAMRDLDDEVNINQCGQTYEAFKSFGGFSASDLHLALKAEVATRAMMSRFFRDLSTVEDVSST